MGHFVSYTTYVGAYFLRRICHMFFNTISAVRTVGFEPTLSGSQNRRIPRLSDALTVTQPGEQGTFSRLLRNTAVWRLLCRKQPIKSAVKAINRGPACP